MKADNINEKKLLISIIGCLEALYSNCISINESESYLFSPHSIRKISELGFNKNIISIMEKGCELEDIASLLPHKLPKVIKELKGEAKELLKMYDKIEGVFWAFDDDNNFL